jgi:hypothetical protein
LKGSKKNVFEELAINRRREDSRAEYEEMKREESSLEKKPLEFYLSLVPPHLTIFWWGSFQSKNQPRHFQFASFQPQENI